jgi:hypothetical protein
MIDYKVIYKIGGEITDTIITIYDDIYIEDEFERSEIIRELLCEKLIEQNKGEFDTDEYELIEFEELFEKCDLYKFSGQCYDFGDEE